jgi:SAM-dependent methyltransferase
MRISSHQLNEQHLRSFWNNSRLWLQYGNGSSYEERRQALESIMPSNVTSILDVGTGQGEVINQLPLDLKVVGLDISCTALQKVRRPKIIGKIEALPFSPTSFDLVLCLEVLEHLPDSAFFSAIVELQRVAKCWLLIGVPFKENLLTRAVRCPSCRHLFNTDTHFRAFASVRRISKLFREFTLQTHLLVGPSFERKTLLGQWLSLKLGVYIPWESYFLCPICGNTEPPLQRSHSKFLANLCRRFDCRLSRMRTPIPYWFIGLLQRVK